MKVYCYILLFFMLNSCKEKEAISFESIEVAYDSGWAVRHITVISNDGTVKRITGFSNDGVNPVFSFIDTLSTNTFDSISDEVSKLKNVQLKTLYKENCMDCSSYAIKIKTKRETILCVIKGDPQINIAKLCSKISELKISKNRKINTNFDYDTPEYLMERVNFIRPDDSITQQYNN